MCCFRILAAVTARDLHRRTGGGGGRGSSILSFAVGNAGDDDVIIGSSGNRALGGAGNDL